MWFGVLAGLWIALVAAEPVGVYLGFALFFVALDRFSTRTAVPVVAALTAVVIVATTIHQQGVTAAAVIGPVIGAAVAIAMGLGYQSLERENEQRRALIEELHEARDALARAEHARGVLEERERLAREIHDTVAQGLASVVILLGAAEQDLRLHQVDAARTLLDQARATARLDLDEARRFVRELAPAPLDGTTLDQALERVCAHATSDALAVTFTTSGEPCRLSPTLEVALLRITQAALANVVAHASARHCRVTLTFMSDVVALDIHDDGHGFDPAVLDERRKSGSFGLVAMRQRVEALGGRFTVDAAPGEGTVVAAALPVSTTTGNHATANHAAEHPAIEHPDERAPRAQQVTA